MTRRVRVRVVRQPEIDVQRLAAALAELARELAERRRDEERQITPRKEAANG